MPDLTRPPLPSPRISPYYRIRHVTWRWVAYLDVGLQYVLVAFTGKEVLAAFLVNFGGLFVENYSASSPIDMMKMLAGFLFLMREHIHSLINFG